MLGVVDETELAAPKVQTSHLLQRLSYPSGSALSLQQQVLSWAGGSPNDTNEVGLSLRGPMRIGRRSCMEDGEAWRCLR